MQSSDLKNHNLEKDIPPVVFGTSGLGNLYEEVSFDTKLSIIKECITHSFPLTIFDSAGKYGAGLSLEVLGKALSKLHVDSSKVIISNKLGWYRIPLQAQEPTFEPGVWKGLNYDAVQRISYEGIMDCYDQGNSLLGNYHAQWVSVHDPDEYLANAKNPAHEEKLYQDVLGAYRALQDLKSSGKVEAIGVGSKDWKVIERLSRDVSLDWVMIANSLTIYDHPEELIRFIQELKAKNVLVINSAVFNGGFLVGSDYFNYKFVDKDSVLGNELYNWRNRFWKICNNFQVDPAHACINFGLKVDGVNSIALNTTKPTKVKLNVDMVKEDIMSEFWEEMRAHKLINPLVI